MNSHNPIRTPQQSAPNTTKPACLPCTTVVCTDLRSQTSLSSDKPLNSLKSTQCQSIAVNPGQCKLQTADNGQRHAISGVDNHDVIKTRKIVYYYTFIFSITRPQVNSSPSQLVPGSTRTQVNSYQGELVPKSTRT